MIPLPSKTFIEHFLIGGTVGATTRAATYPLEQIKIALQVQDLRKNHKFGTPYQGFADAFLHVSKKAGYLRLWRGSFKTILKYFPTQALHFSTKHVYRTALLDGVDKRERFWIYVFGNLAAGGLAGASTLCFVYPLEYVKTRLAADFGRSKGERQFRGLIDCITKTLHSDGPAGLYRGFAVALLGITIFRSCYFGIYDTAKDIFPDPKHTPFLVSYIIAQTVTTYSGVMSYPFDTVGRRMMMQSVRKKKQVIYKSTLDCCIKMATKEGIEAFYRGGWTNVLWGIGAAIHLVLFDKIKVRLGSYI